MMRMTRALLPSLSAAGVSGWIGAAAAWTIASGWSDITPMLSSYDRLDQYVALLLGACSGGSVLVLRARHRREPLLPALGAGLLLGGVASLVGATMGLLLRGVGTTGFLLQRIATWSLLAACGAAALATYSRTRRTISIATSFGLAAVGGAIAGVIFSLPGPSELWMPLAMTWCGAAMGFAAVGPAMWRAPVVVQLQPPLGQRHSIWSLHERAVDNGWSTPVGEGQIGCVDDTVFVYPPPAGAILDGYPLYRATPLTRAAVIAVGRTRFLVTPRRG